MKDFVCQLAKWLVVVGILPTIFNLILLFCRPSLVIHYHKEQKTPKTISLKAKRYSNPKQYSNRTSYYIFYI